LKINSKGKWCCQKLMQPNVKKSLNFCIITLAKLGLMITHLGVKQKVFALSGFEFRMNLDIPASKFLPEGESCIPSVVYDLNNRLNL
jgi:hypothetical protein